MRQFLVVLFFWTREPLPIPSFPPKPSKQLKGNLSKTIPKGPRSGKFSYGLIWAIGRLRGRHKKRQEDGGAITRGDSSLT